MSIYNLQTTCTEQQLQIVNGIQNKTIDGRVVVKLPFLEITKGNGWFTITSPNVYVLIYRDTTSDPSYYYLIKVVKTPGVTIDCTSITIMKKNKIDGTDAPDNIIPQTTINTAIATFPTTCGTGLWNGCTAGIQNQYLIVGGGLVAAYMYLKGR